MALAKHKTMSHLVGNILIVEDEYGIRLFLEHLLRRDGHTVVLADSGEAAIPLINQELDLAILDLNLGKGMSGIDVLQEIRQHAPETEVVLLTGHGTLETAVAALREGAHDYLFKPCEAKQIRASIASALQKRFRLRQQDSILTRLEQNLSLLSAFKSESQSSPTIPRPPLPSDTQAERENEAEAEKKIQHGRVTIDKIRHTIHLKNTLLELSSLEFDILTYLTEQAPRVVSPQDIVQAIHGYDDISAVEASDVVRSNIYRIRQKIRQIDDSTPFIRTVRGVGYTLAE